ncbi:MAG: hypothetical protein ACOX0G_00505 [Patescibacteria group bacterium]|jgi:hypothetical protein|nr:hypothetical protein [bacterium]HOR57886.1 hypothetical protein [bacterium]
MSKTWKIIVGVGFGLSFVLNLVLLYFLYGAYLHTTTLEQGFSSLLYETSLDVDTDTVK